MKSPPMKKEKAAAQLQILEDSLLSIRTRQYFLLLHSLRSVMEKRQDPDLGDHHNRSSRSRNPFIFEWKLRPILHHGSRKILFRRVDGNSYCDTGTPLSRKINRKKSRSTGVLDSLQSLDVLAAEKDVVFLVLARDMQATPLAIPKQLGAVANNLANSGQRIAVFTVKSGTPDHERLVRHFSVNAFPCVVILGRQGSASAVAQDISEARLYNAFVLASQAASCCPGQANTSCCPPQTNASCCPK